MQVSRLSSLGFLLLTVTRTLAQEEPDITSVAVRPGMVDTNVIVHMLFSI